jgi:hypothetical protein
MLVGRCCWFGDGLGGMPYAVNARHGHGTAMRGSSLAPDLVSLTHTQHILEVIDRQIKFLSHSSVRLLPRFSSVHLQPHTVSVDGQTNSNIFGGSFKSKRKMRACIDTSYYHIDHQPLAINHRPSHRSASAWQMAYSRLA